VTLPRLVCSGIASALVCSAGPRDVSADIASTATFDTSTSSVHGSSAKDRNEYTGRWRVVHNYVSAGGYRDNALDHGDDRGGHDIINNRRGVDGLGITARLPGRGRFPRRANRSNIPEACWPAPLRFVSGLGGLVASYRYGDLVQG